MGQLSKDELERLKQHKYSSTGTSLVEPYFQVYWKWLIEFFPLWVAPNAITFLGLIVNFVTSSLLIFYCSTATETAPSWVFFVNGLGLFIYQSLDAIDGKQARRTGSSTPLGELFDHGMDSISTVLVAQAISITMKLGELPWWMFFMCLSSYFTFYFSHWCSYVTGTLQFGLIDVTELQLSTIMCFFITSIAGQEFWSSKVFMFDFTLQHVVATCVFIGCIYSCFRFGKLLFKGGCGRNGSTIADTGVLSPGINIFLVIFFACCTAYRSEYGILEKDPVLFLVFIGINSAKVTNRIIVAHMCRSELPYLDRSQWGPFFIIFNQYMYTLINERWMFIVCCIYNLWDLIDYMINTYNQIADSYGIYVFSLAPRKKIS